jgi:polysaccharide biosynthesis transport protein
MNSASESNQVVNMSDAIKGIWHRKLLILSLLMLGILAGLTIITLLKPSYQSEAQVIIENLATPYEKANVALEARGEPLSDRVVLSQVSIMKSGDMGARVVDKLNLSANPEFNPLLRSSSSLKKLLVTAGFAEDSSLLTPIQLATKRLDSKLTVYQTPDSNVIGIKYQAGDPQTAADVANAIAESYVLSTRETEAGSTGRAREWLSQQITDLRGKVSAAEAAVEKYRSEAGLLKGEKATLGTQQISELNSQITLAEAASSETAARADEIRNLLSRKGTVDASSDVLSSPLIQRLREQQSTVSQKVSELSAVYLPNHPKMIAAQQELSGINRNIRVEANKVVDSLIGQAKVAAARAKSLRDSLNTLKGTQATANLSDVKLSELERDAQASRTLLEQMLSRYADANARQDLSLQPGFARIIQKAEPQPSNYFPKPGPILALTSFAGLGLGLGLAFLFSVMSSASRGAPAPVEQSVTATSHPARTTLETAAIIPALNIGWPVSPVSEDTAIVVSEPKPTPEKAPQEKTLSVLGAMPSAHNLGATLAMIESTYNNSSTPLTDAAARIANACLVLKDHQALNTIAITSIGGRGLDASVATVAVARAMAAAKKKTVAIDLSSANSPFDTMFEVEPGCGISDLVAGEADFTKVICRDAHSSAHIIRYGLKSSPQYQAIVAEKLAPILKALAGIYDVILLHAGEASPATPNLVKDCKGTMLLAPQSRYKDAVAAARVLESKGMPMCLFVRLEPTADTATKQAVSA